MKFLLLTILAAVAMADEQEVQRQLQQGNNLFTANMFSEVVKKNPGKSVVMSGFSVLTPLAQLGLASEGATHDELLQAMDMPNDDTVKEVFKLVNNKLRTVKGVDLRMASRVYIPLNYELDDNFKGVSRDLFGTEPKNIDFEKSDDAANEINAWVEEQTNHRIKDLVSKDSLNGATRAVLANAIYFKGQWKDPFKPENTVDSDFHVSAEKTVKVPMMKRTGDYLYTESAELDAKLLRLPYTGDEASMLIVLPNKVDGLASLEEKLKDPQALQKATEQMHTFEVDVALPKFKIETTTDLKEVLQNLNVKKLFTNEAQLTHLLKSGEPLYVSDAKQKAFIEVNEEGAEAAAANVFRPLGAAWNALPKYMIFHADRPFYLDIRVNRYSLPLFNGVVQDLK